jgi:hypothetical protein
MANRNRHYPGKVTNTITGFIDEKRSQLFDSQAVGLRGLLKISVSELNERQWPFFRFVIMEVVHCPSASKPISDRLATAAPGSFEEMYKTKLSDILTEVRNSATLTFSKWKRRR